MKRDIYITLTLGLLSLAAFGQTKISLTIDTQAPGRAIPSNFAGVSIFTGTQVRDHRGVPGNLFSGTNTQLITLFRNAGLRHLRLGATGPANSGSQNLNHEDIDSLFAFAKATGIKVIYSLHFIEGAATAKYVWENYRPYVDCFAFDNEPDSRLNEGATNAPGGRQDYFTSWRDFAKSVTDAVPGAKFAGPDAAGRTLVKRFVAAEKDYGRLALVTQHCYVGGNPRKRSIDTPHAIEEMLSSDWVSDKYPQLYNSVLKPVEKQGLPFRLTELDDYVHGVTNASDAFASALWALDALHWWAAHGATGVNFQNTEWLHTDTFYLDSDRNYQVYPKAYGIRAFDLGGHGRVAPLAVGNYQALNLTAYAVLDSTNLYVTIINKEHGPGARSADASIFPQGFTAGDVSVMSLISRDGDVGATNGVSLGGATITNNAPWQGRWTPAAHFTNGWSLVVVASSAAIVRISATVP